MCGVSLQHRVAGGDGAGGALEAGALPEGRLRRRRGGGGRLDAPRLRQRGARHLHHAHSRPRPRTLRARTGAVHGHGCVQTNSGEHAESGPEEEVDISESLQQQHCHACASRARDQHALTALRTPSCARPCEQPGPESDRQVVRRLEFTLLWIHCKVLTCVLS